MKTWINIIVWYLKRKINPAVWAELEALIEQAETHVVSGQKRTWVLARLAELPEPLRAMLSSTAGWLINFALEALVAKLNVEAGSQANA